MKCFAFSGAFPKKQKLFLIGDFWVLAVRFRLPVFLCDPCALCERPSLSAFVRVRLWQKNAFSP
jgi:hypothetical protein